MALDKWKHAKPPVREKVGYRVLIHKYFILPNGKESMYTTIGEKDAQNIAAVAVTPDKKMVIARQFRHGPEQIFDELPGGGVEPNEDLAKAAARELLEETGYASDQPLEFLGAMYRDSHTNEASNYYLARDCRKVAEQKLDESEFIEVDLISIEQLIVNAKTGRMTDGAGVLMAYDELMKILSS